MIMAQRYAKMTEPRLREAFSKMSEVMKRGREASQEQAGQEVPVQDNEASAKGTG